MNASRPALAPAALRTMTRATPPPGGIATSRLAEASAQVSARASAFARAYAADRFEPSARHVPVTRSATPISTTTTAPQPTRTTLPTVGAAASPTNNGAHGMGDWNRNNGSMVDPDKIPAFPDNL